MTASVSKFARLIMALLGVLALVVFGSASFANAAGLVVDIGHTHEGVLAINNPSTQIVYIDNVDDAMAAATAHAAPGETTALTAAGFNALLLNGKAAEIAALPGTKLVLTYQDPSARGGVLSQLHLVQQPAADPNILKFQLVREYSLLDDAPSVVGIGMPVALLNSIATTLMTSEQDYRDGWNGGLPYQAFYNDPENPDNGFTAVLIAPDLALTVLIRSVPVVGPPLATITEPMLRRLVNSSYPEGRRDDGSLMTEYAPNPGLTLPSLESQVDLIKQLPGDLKKGWDNYQAQQQPPATDPAPEPDPEPESFAPDSSDTNTGARTSGVDSESSQDDDADAPKTNVVRNSLTAKPGQKFADDVNKTVKQVNGDLQRTVHQVQTGLEQAGRNLQGAIHDAVGNLTKPHKPSTGKSGTAGSNGESGGSNSGSSGSGANSGGDK